MAGLDDLTARLAELEDIPSRIAKAVCVSINAEIAKEFLNGTDAYGNSWQPLAESTINRKGFDTILVETDELARETKAVPTSGSGIEIRSIERGQFHQLGGPNLPVRPILPDGEDLPEAWADAIDKEAEKAFRRVLK